MTVTEEELEAGAKALCQPNEVSDLERDTYWDRLSEALRELYREDAIKVLNAAAKVREKVNG